MQGNHGQALAVQPGGKPEARVPAPTYVLPKGIGQAPCLRFFHIFKMGKIPNSELLCAPLSTLANSIHWPAKVAKWSTDWEDLRAASTFISNYPQMQPPLTWEAMIMKVKQDNEVLCK